MRRAASAVARPLAAVAALAVATALATALAAAPLAAQRAWSVDPRPALDIPGGAADGSVNFEQAVGATRLSNGQVVVVDGLAQAIRWFDAAGRPVRSVGRAGNGPGEFGGLWWGAQCGADSIHVLDVRRGRVHVLGADGTLVRDFAVPAVGPRGQPTTIACSRAGSYAYVGIPHDLTPASRELPVSRGAAPFALGDATGAIVRPLPDVQSGELVVLGGGGMPRPLGRQTTVAVAGDRVYVGTADSGLVDVYALDGRRLPPVRLRTETRAPTDAQYATAIEVSTQPVPANARERVRGMLRQQVPKPASLPAYAEVHADPAGTLWVNLSLPGDAGTRLQALSPDGRALGEVRIPVALRVFEVGTDWVLGEHQDAGGETHVMLWRVRRGG